MTLYVCNGAPLIDKPCPVLRLTMECISVSIEVMPSFCQPQCNSGRYLCSNRTKWRAQGPTAWAPENV